ncbi:hypothetical protein TNCV_1283431 [Trichonephila clavipes]|uniref:Uncharacterized protein n=1 Tax=Trichonephila clavipes TaxID=2585209 RepID=A0A8X6VP25_TRICX|nr:hypothetical protein TNCV_1283431 [Trichonephila clavipes]
MTDQWYVHDILQPHMLPLMQQLPGALFQQDNARPPRAKVSHCYYCPIPRFLSPIKHIWDHLGRKDELKIVVEELNLTVPEGAKIADLKNLIVNSDVYKNDKELVQSAIDYALAEIKNKRLDSETKLKFERIKLVQLQKQLELANIQKNLIENSDIQNPSVF